MSTRKLLKNIIKQTILEAYNSTFFPVVKDPTMSWDYLSNQFYRPTEDGRRLLNALQNDYRHYRHDDDYNHSRHDNDYRQSQREITQAIKDEVPKNWQTMSKDSQIVFFIKVVKNQVNRRRFHSGRLPQEMVEGWYRYYYNVFFGTKPNETTLNKEKNPHETTFEEIMNQVNEMNSSH